MPGLVAAAGPSSSVSSSAMTSRLYMLRVFWVPKDAAGDGDGGAEGD